MCSYMCSYINTQVEIRTLETSIEAIQYNTEQARFAQLKVRLYMCSYVCSYINTQVQHRASHAQLQVGFKFTLVLR